MESTAETMRDPIFKPWDCTVIPIMSSLKNRNDDDQYIIQTQPLDYVSENGVSLYLLFISFIYDDV